MSPNGEFDHHRAAHVAVRDDLDIYEGNVQVITACIFLLLFIFISDGLDGWVARRRGTTSDFGAVFDIASDRIVENALWVVFAQMGLIPGVDSLARALAQLHRRRAPLFILLRGENRFRKEQHDAVTPD